VQHLISYCSIVTTGSCCLTSHEAEADLKMLLGLPEVQVLTQSSRFKAQSQLQFDNLVVNTDKSGRSV